MTHPGPEAAASTPGEQPSGATATPQPPAEAPAERSGLKKWLPAVGSLAVAGVVAVSWLTGGFGPGEPAVGDCGMPTGETSFEVVECDAEGAEFTIVGVQEGAQTYPEFRDDQNSCAEFPGWEVALWSGETPQEGTVYCAEGL